MAKWPVAALAGLMLGLLLPASSASRDGRSAVDDTFPSGATAVIELTGLPPFTLQLSSQGLPDAVVQRGPLVGDTIETEMLSLQLRGTTTIFGQQAEAFLQAGTSLTAGRPRSTGRLTGVKTDASGKLWRSAGVFDLQGNATFVLGNRQQFHYEWAMTVDAEPWIFDLPPNRPIDQKLGRVDHYKCYGIKPRERFRRRSVVLSDQFEDEKATVVRPLTLCAPVRKNDGRLLRPTAHLECYSITSTSDRPKKPEVEVTVTNQFGTAQLVVLGPKTLCLPTLKKKVRKLVPRPPPPAGSLTALTDHFKCYGVRTKSAFAQRTVSLDDQFETERAQVLRPVLLCPPAEKNAVKLRDSTTHMVCYTIQDRVRKEKAGGRLVVVRNQFGVETLAVQKPQLLCVPSTKKPPCSVYAERSRAPLRQGGQIVGYINEARHVPFLGNTAGSCP